MRQWAFMYDGPVTTKMDLHCPMCVAASTGTCNKTALQHGSNKDGCSTCYAARVKHCHNHSGIQESLDFHQKNGQQVDHDSFKDFSIGMLAQVAALPTDRKYVHIHAVYFDDADGARDQTKVTVEFMARNSE